MANSYQYYPVGLRAPIDGMPLQQTKADAEVQNLYKLLLANDTMTDTWKFRRLVIDAAVRLLPDFDLFIVSQHGNDRVKPNALELLNDTVEFIATGQRRVQVMTRYSIMCLEHNPPYDSARTQGLIRKVELKSTGLRGRDALTTWIRHEGGLEDMLCTLNALFGDLA